MLALWLWVRLESPGPGFFTQTRVGRDGRLFTLGKLRRDPRITSAGRFLRKTSLDELPQLVNVVRGQMSLHGPRPALPSKVAKYDVIERRRLAVLPGMTGLWQVSGRSELSREQSVNLDLRYTDNYHLAGDLLIGLRTVDAVVRPHVAY
jgi:lipopolysaccharide/colanic/teichoic acid biosynthesis glycosyltransferase